MKLTEADLLRSCLSSLGAETGPTDSYETIRRHEDANALYYLGAFGTPQFVPREVSRETIAHIVEDLRGQPMDSGEIRAALFELWLTTKHEKMPPEDRDAMLLVYVRRLSDFPAPTVQVVLNEFGQSSKFFPAWSEIKERLDELMGWRAGLINALRRIIQRQQKDQAK